VIASANNPAVVVVTLGLAMSASPFGILGVVVLLGSRRPLANAWAFTIGWATSITVFGLVTYRLAAQSSTSTSTSTSTSRSTSAATISQAALGFALGAVLLVLGLRLWLTRHRQGKSSSEPKWMTQAERISPVFAFGLGLFLPTWGMIVPAVGQIAGAGLSRGASLALFGVFVLMATSTLLLPVLVYTFRRQWSASMLAGWQAWLLTNARAVIAVICLVLGILMALRGAAALL